MLSNSSLDASPVQSGAQCPSVPMAITVPQADSRSSSGFATPQGSPPLSLTSPLAQLCLQSSDSNSSPDSQAGSGSGSSSNSSSTRGSAPASDASGPASDSEDGLQVWTRAQVKEEAFKRDSCLLIIGDFVYDVSGFLRLHPGGREILQENVGADATNAFNSTHSARARRMLARYCVGRLLSRRSPPVQKPCTKPDELLEGVRNALQKH